MSRSFTLQKRTKLGGRAFVWVMYLLISQELAILQFHFFSSTRSRRRMAKRNRVQPAIKNARRNARSPAVEYIEREREYCVHSTSVESRNNNGWHVTSLMTRRPESELEGHIGPYIARAASLAQQEIASRRFYSG